MAIFLSQAARITDMRLRVLLTVVFIRHPGALTPVSPLETPGSGKKKTNPAFKEL